MLTAARGTPARPSTGCASAWPRLTGAPREAALAGEAEEERSRVEAAAVVKWVEVPAEAPVEERAAAGSPVEAQAEEWSSAVDRGVAW